MFKLMGMEINAILGAQTILIWTYVTSKRTGSRQANFMCIKLHLFSYPSDYKHMGLTLEKPLWGFRQYEIQTSLLSFRD